MTAALPSATLTQVAPGHAEGPLDGHPGHLIVYTQKYTPDEMAVGLWVVWDGGRELRGSGLLHLADGVWRGEVKEGRAIWHVTARAGSARLEFYEQPPA